MLDDSEVVVNQSQGQIDRWVTDTAKARLNTQTHQHTDRQTDRQADRVDKLSGQLQAVLSVITNDHAMLKCKSML